MIIACAICSSLGPMLLAGFFLKDWLELRRK
jgi:hypothetical protein